MALNRLLKMEMCPSAFQLKPSTWLATTPPTLSPGAEDTAIKPQPLPYDCRHRDLHQDPVWPCCPLSYWHPQEHTAHSLHIKCTLARARCQKSNKSNEWLQHQKKKGFWNWRRISLLISVFSRQNMFSVAICHIRKMPPWFSSWYHSIMCCDL